MRKLLIAAALAALTVPAATATVVYPNATFTDRNGTYPAMFSIDSICAGPAIATLEIWMPGKVDTRVVGVQNVVAPDPCLVDCSFPCPIPFSWSMITPETLALKPKYRVAVDGVGVTRPLTWELAGYFTDGVLETHQIPPWNSGPQ